MSPSRYVVHNDERVVGADEADMDPRLDNETRVEPIESTERYHFDNEHKYTHVDKAFIAFSKIRGVLQKHADLFAWSTIDMLGIDPKVVNHKLSIFWEVRSMAQKKMKMGREKREAAKAKVQKLVSVGFIKETTYTTWLANILLVKKSNGKWRMCTDYTNLNNACPNNTYPLPSIDKPVDGVTGHKVLYFLDVYSR